MIVGIDASAFLVSNKTGVEITTCNLISAIIEKDRENKYWLYSPKSILNLPKFDNVENKVISGKKFWTQCYLSKELKNNPPDIFWAPSHMLPNFLPKKSVATIHDLTWKIMPSIYTPIKRFFSKLTVDRAIKHATKLVAVSEQTKKDLIKYFDVPDEKIEVVYHALNKNFITSSAEPSFKIQSPYFLFVGRIESRKNILNIIKAYSLFTKTNQEIKLVLVGSPGNQYKKALDLVQNLKLAKSIIFLNYVDLKDLVSLYKNSVAFVFPSFYEGFGVPILEAFALKTPVITSALGSMKEIACDAALLVNPKDPSDISRAMIKIISEPSLKNNLIEKGKDRLQDFSWEKSADKMINLWKIL